jgi:hypothetical protein
MQECKPHSRPPVPPSVSLVHRKNTAWLCLNGWHVCCCMQESKPHSRPPVPPTVSVVHGKNTAWVFLNGWHVCWCMQESKPHSRPPVPSISLVHRKHTVCLQLEVAHICCELGKQPAMEHNPTSPTYLGRWPGEEFNSTCMAQTVWLC